MDYKYSCIIVKAGKASHIMEENMKRVAILTITDGANYGNRLQNYAMQELLKSCNCCAITIKRFSTRDIKNSKKFFLLIKDFIKIIIRKKNTRFVYRKRVNLFEQFNNRFISFSDEKLGFNRFPNGIEDNYDYFLCGSDQVWNARYDFIQEDINNYLASFAKPEKRIAFAASFGTNDIAPEYEKTFEDELKNFKVLGIREKSGVELANKLGKRNDAQLVLDPILMLSKNQWINLEQKPNYISDKKFIITYFLGGRSEKIKHYLEKMSSIYNAEVINLDVEFLTDDKIENEAHFCTTPNEFVWLIRNAECILTDSFHATVFSIIFNKPFIVFKRIATEKGNDMSGRIDTLLGLFGLSNCIDDVANPSKTPFRYKDVTNKINLEREKSLSFIRKALDEI